MYLAAFLCMYVCRRVLRCVCIHDSMYRLYRYYEYTYRSGLVNKWHGRIIKWRVTSMSAPSSFFAHPTLSCCEEYADRTSSSTNFHCYQMMLRRNNFYSYRDPCEALKSCQRAAGLEEVRNHITWDKTFTNPAMNRRHQVQDRTRRKVFIDSTSSNKMAVTKICQEN